MKRQSPASNGIDNSRADQEVARARLSCFIFNNGIILDPERCNGQGLCVSSGGDYVKEVTHIEAVLWDEKDEQSCSFNSSSVTEKGARAIARSAAAADIRSRVRFWMK